MSDTEQKIYYGACHCGGVKFELKTNEITSACVCNCSICRRKNSLMSDDYFAPNEFFLMTDKAHLKCYQFGDHDVNHYFCDHCGIYTFHDGTNNPGHYRVNLGCLTGIQLGQLSVRKIDRASF